MKNQSHPVEFARLDADMSLFSSLRSLGLIATWDGEISEEDRKLAEEAYNHVVKALELLRQTKFPDNKPVNFQRKEYMKIRKTRYGKTQDGKRFP